MTTQAIINDIISKFASNTLIVKWENMGTWQKHSEFSNYAEAMKYYNIKIINKKDEIVIKLQCGLVKIELIGTLADLELYTMKAICMFCLHLGDKAKIITRFGTEKINF